MCCEYRGSVVVTSTVLLAVFVTLLQLNVDLWMHMIV